MACNAIQFQKCLSEVPFQENYGTENRCEAVLETMRWPEGFVYPEIDGTKRHRLHSRNLHLCAICRRQTALIADIIFEHTQSL